VRVKLGGGLVVQRQCEDCLRGLGEEVQLEAFSRRNRFPSWLQAERPNAKRRDYEDELKSPRMRALRLVVFARDGYLCQSCARAGAETEATDLAHLTYERFGAELETDLEASCSACNQGERAARIAAKVLGP
jgi:5-methylcytosine-specific restriction endonuclease McrA